MNTYVFHIGWGEGGGWGGGEGRWAGRVTIIIFLCDKAVHVLCFLHKSLPRINAGSVYILGC